MTNSLASARYSPAINARIHALEAHTPLVRFIVNLRRADVRLEVLHPASIDPLLDDVAHDPEFNMPYWAEIWPSGIALASAILMDPAVVRGKPVIELGCGLGITAAAAVMARADLLATDYSPHSLQLTELTCLLAGQHPPATRQLNWRDPDADVLQHSGERWPVVIAADVLYEARDIEPILALLDRIVTPGGLVWLAEPGRAHARTAVDALRLRGWQVTSILCPGPWPGSPDVTVHLHTIVKPPFAD